MGSKHKKRPQPASDNGNLRIGQRVRIVGLTRCAELNFSTAVVMLPADDNGRVSVQLTSSERIVRVARDNLQVTDGLTRSGCMDIGGLATTTGETRYPESIQLCSHG